jgi:hypothetical protein
MFDVVREALIWLMSWILDRRPHGTEAFRVLSLLVFSVLATWITLYWKDLAYRSPAMRRRLIPDERYAGRYLQAVWRGGAVNYTLVDIYFNPVRKRHEVTGRTYDAAGKSVSAFRSGYMLFPSEKDNNIEFIWQGAGNASGYTRMSIEASQPGFIEGEGFVMTFEAEPKAFPLQFKLLRDDYVRNDLGVPVPRQADEEARFVLLFNAKFGALIKNKFAASVMEAA